MTLRLGRRRAAVLLALALAGVPGPAAQAAAATPATVLTVLGEGGHLLGHGTLAYTDFGSTTVHVSDQPGRDQIGVVSDGDTTPRATVYFGAPADRPRLEIGHYTASRDVTPDGGMLDVAVEGRACSATTGSFDVLGLSRGADGRLTGLALDYAVTCGGDPAPVRGSLRWNSDVLYRYTAVGELRAPDTGTGLTARGTLTVTNAGTVLQTYGRSTWQPDPGMGSAQAPVTITDDRCAGATLAPGGRCTVAVSMVSDGVHGVGGHLRTPDGTPRGAAYSLVTMRAVPSPTPVTLTATPDRGGVGLSTSAYNPTYLVLRATAGGAEVEVARDVAMPWRDAAVTSGTSYAYRVVPVSGGLVGAASNRVVTGPLPVPVGEDGTFVPVDPVRVLDTRDGTGGRHGPLGPGARMRFDPAGTGDIPASGVSAVLLNITGTEATTVTHVRAWPAGDPLPDTSSLNFVPRQNRGNQVVVRLGEDGQVELYNNAGSAHLVVDLQGFYSDVDGPPGGGFHPVRPERVLDTRLDGGPLGPGEEAWLPVSAPGVIWTEVSAVDVNLTVTQPTAFGHITAWPGDLEAPSVSNANYRPGQTIANHAVVPVSFDENGEPGIAVRNSAGWTHLVVDVQGWYDDGARADGLRFRAAETVRVLDTRFGGGLVDPGRQAAVPADALPPAVAHVVNVTAAGGLGAGHLTAWSGAGDLPEASTVNFAPNEDSPNLATASVGPAGGFVVAAGTSRVHVIVDHLGFFY